MTEPSVDASGLSYGRAGTGPEALRTYYSDDATPATVVVTRFVADGRDGHLLLTTEEPLPGQTITAVTIGGAEEVRPATIIHNLRVYRRNDHGFATYWRGNHEAAQTWCTHNARPSDHPRWDLDGHDFHGTVPNDAVLPIEDLHRAMLEFIRTGRQPTAVGWRSLD